MTAAPAGIEDYGVIGDGRSVALVSRFGAIDWLCWPRFECPPIFGGLLDPERGGAWRISPMGVTAIRRRYIEGTNVLLTEVDTGSGACVLTELMTIGSEQDKARMLFPDHEVIRRIECTRATSWSRSRYVAAFHAWGGPTWWKGALIGLVHAALVLAAGMPALPGLHPRMASEARGPTVVRQLEPPGFLALHYGRRTPISVVIAHLAFGIVLGVFYTPGSS